MRLDSDHTNLFLVTIHAFVVALPSVPGRDEAEDDPDKLILLNSIGNLRFEIRDLQNTLTKERAEYDIPSEDHGRASNHVEDILNVLDDLIDDAIPNQFIYSPFTSFAKLEALENVITNGGHHHSGQDEAHVWISYASPGKPKPVQYRQTAREAQRFNGKMKAIFSSHGVGTHASTHQLLHRSRHDDAENLEQDDRAIEAVKSLAETTKTIAGQLSQSACCNPHPVYLHLDGFDGAGIETIMRGCSGRKEREWRTVLWTSGTGQRVDNKFARTVPSTICALVAKSKTLLRIAVHPDRSWNTLPRKQIDRIPGYPTPPSMALQDLLNTNPGRPLRMDLSVKIVQSLLCLIGTPFLQTPWTSEEMLVPRPGESAFGGQRLNKVYVRKEMQNASPDILAVGANTKSIILHLGVLLWELIFRKKVEITDDDVESDDEGGTISLHDVSLHNALGREYNDRNYDAASDDPAFLEIIDKCLDAFSDEELDNEKLRSTVYFTIFKPLQHYLQSHQKRIPSATLATRRLPSPSPASSRIGKRLRTEQKMNACYEQHRANYHLPRFTGSFSAPTGTIVLTANFTANESKTENESLYLDTNLDTESSSWLNRFDAANTNLATPAGSDLPRSVKIAILDTGCDIAHQFFSGPGINKADELQDRWADFLDESSEPVDGDAGRHGTALTCLLLRLAPGAKIYVIRVAKDSNGLLGARKVVAKAILHAVREWDVDIISMSFGFSDEVTSIREAITEAQRIKEGRILFFAAANNNGLNGPELFPAFFESVIAVRGTSHDGTFMPQYTPKMWAHKHEVQYGTLAIDVPCGWVDNTLTKSGCSVATPMMVAIAAALISFVEHEDSLLRQRDLIRTRRGMLSVFNHMADGQPDRNQRVYLAPWQLFKDNQPPRSLVEYALSLLPQITPA